jgi:glycine oxidase
MPAKGADVSSDVVIVGAGVIGLSIAWRAAARGLEVTLVDPEPAGGASHVAAGMLTPVSELTYGEEPLLHLGVASRNAYPEFVAELEELTGLDTGHRHDGLLEVAFDGDDLAVLDDVRRFQSALGVRTEALNGRECRRLEPMLAPAVRGGLFAPDDGSIDPRRLTAALLAAATKLGVRLVRARVAEVIVEKDRAEGVRLEDGSELRAAQTLLAAGCETHRIGGLPPDLVPTARPVKGQVIRLRGTGPYTEVPFINRTVRAMVKGSSIYLVPRRDGEIVLGATQEEQGYDTTVTAGGIWELLRDAREILPGITELEFTEVKAGLRPGSPDNAPVLGHTALPGLLLATGHFRNGILLTPITATAMAAVLVGDTPPEVIAPFTPGRFR